MGTYKGPEKRSTKRTPLTTFCPATFRHGRKKYSALMVDVSEAGARFRLQELTQTCELKVGTKLQVEIRTPYGPTQCRVAVVWAQHLDGYYNWGVRFISLPEAEDDPLRSLLQSSF
jgi:hypothetical protein